MPIKILKSAFFTFVAAFLASLLITIDNAVSLSVLRQLELGFISTFIFTFLSMAISGYAIGLAMMWLSHRNAIWLVVIGSLSFIYYAFGIGRWTENPDAIWWMPIINLTDPIFRSWLAIVLGLYLVDRFYNPTMRQRNFQVFNMTPPPADWPRLSSSIYYNNAGQMIDWLTKAFGFKVRIRIDGDNGQVEHSELEYGEALIMVSDTRGEKAKKFAVNFLSPIDANGTTQSIMIFVDDVDAHCKQAREAGATIVAEPELYDYGADYWSDRSYGVLDPENRLWWFTTRIRDRPT